MKGLIKDPSPFLGGSTLSINVNVCIQLLFGGKNEYLAYINIYAILVPKYFFEFHLKNFYNIFTSNHKK